MSEKLLLSHLNRSDSAALSGGFWSLPLAALQTRELDDVARSTNATTASTQLVATWIADQAVRVVSLQNHNLGLAATVRIVLKPAVGDPLYDVTVDAWPDCFDDGAGPRKPTAEEIEHYPAWHFVHVLPAEVAGVRTMELYVTDTANADGYVQAGRLWAGPAWQPTRNMAYGLTLGWSHTAPEERTPGGALFTGDGYRLRTGRFSLSWLTPADGRLAFDFSGAVGVTGEMIVVLEPDTALDMARTSFPARMAQLSPLEYPALSHRSMAFDLEELIPGA
jgi:hypothetical protein